MSEALTATPYAKLFAAVYDTAFARAERAGLRECRRALLSAAHGRVVELGAGTGLNFELYPPVQELLLTEPDAAMAKQLRRRVAASEREATVVEAPAAALPLQDASFDIAVATLVLCTVPDSPAALAEVRRILKPGGRLLFVEHVRSRNPSLAHWQDRLERPWWYVARGCHCNRDTFAAIAAAGFRIEDSGRGEIRGLGPLLRPLVWGSALAPETSGAAQPASAPGQPGALG